MWLERCVCKNVLHLRIDVLELDSKKLLPSLRLLLMFFYMHIYFKIRCPCDVDEFRKFTKETFWDHLIGLCTSLLMQIVFSYRIVAKKDIHYLEYVTGLAESN